MLSTAFALPGASVAPRARCRARRTRVPPLRAAAADASAEKRKNPSLYDGSATAAADAGESSTPSAGPAHGPREIVKPEILAPAGGWPQMRAAVEAGADAVYFGLNLLNARARAANFDVEELPEVMSFLHARGVRGFVTMNVLVFDEELAQAEGLVRSIAKAGVDAVIVQDVGLVNLIRKTAPGLAIHGSTQMSITSPEGAEFARELGCKRVVVGRELSVREIAAVRQGTEAEVEAFVHGALCVSYSGQCFSSEAWGGRSANRGQCAQACRLPYGLVVDGQLREMGDVKYLLSPQDLMAVEMVPSLIEAGVGCFKIEGRLKGPEYVALTVSVYRRALDEAWAAREASATRGTRTEEWHLPEADRVDLAQVFARGQDEEYDGLTRGFLEGVKHQRLVRGRGPRHRGPLLGEVTDCFLREGGGVVVRLRGGVPLKRGDGVVFDRGAPDEPEAGGKVWEVLDERGRSVAKTREDAVSTGEFELTFASGVAKAWNWDPVVTPSAGAVGSGSESGYGARRREEEKDARAARPRAPARGDLVWRTSDADLDARLRRMIPEGDVFDTAAVRREPVVVRVTASKIGEPLVITIEDAKGRVGRAVSDGTLTKAEKQPMSLASLAKAVGELGGTPFSLGELDASGVAFDTLDAFVPAGVIKSCRREAVEALVAARVSASGSSAAEGLAERPVAAEMLEAASAFAWFGAETDRPSSAAENGESATESLDSSSREGNEPTSDASAGQMLSLLCRTREQAEAALLVPWLTEITLDFLEVHGLRDAVKAVRLSGRRCSVATPRVLKPDEEKLWRFYLSLDADALLIRSAGLMRTLVALREGGDGKTGPVPPLRGDFSLNAANAVGAAALLERGGLSRLTPTHDLDAKQQAALARALGPERARALEVVIHQHLPIFHTEHCVFCRFLSDGNSYKDCGHPCETSVVHLRDAESKDHLVLADMGCRNTVFNAQAQSGAEYLHDLMDAGVRHFRIELVDEPGSVVRDLLEAYRDAVAGDARGAEVVKWVGTLPDANGNAHGAGRGSLEVRREKDRGTMKQTAAAKHASARRQAARGR
jgi:collagenase-like PrtC family protease